ncbi:MAG TPA: hypothetical protein VE891_10705 [Allosphingosinicella sp.]|nr:hypothetical protein [Allosphingosinicella sp.]
MIRLFQDLKIGVLNLADSIASGPAVTSARDLIEEADFVCVLPEGERTSPNVYFEFGYATALGKPVILISDQAQLPADSTGALRIAAGLDDKEALRIQLLAFVENARVGRKRRSANRKPTAAAFKRGADAEAGSYPAASELHSELERRLVDAFRVSPEVESVAAQKQLPGGGRFLPDLAVWFSNPPESISSPVLVEVKGGLGSNDWGSAVEQIKGYAHAHDIGAGIVIVSGDFALPQRRVVSLAPLIFVLELDESLRLLRQGALLDTLRRERNRFAHSAG